ncbi:uncharacterized protein LOC106011108 [Aplysia californica]|uniref:Uncharacterized protein LOC106011108 n=1 Tax=Aplysia californica TaxID=6500 RepID=A0ABM0ZUY9_APLCA|nr:uncharacterized protein LOC106011108 [Aplysia californica]
MPQKPSTTTTATTTTATTTTTTTTTTITASTVGQEVDLESYKKYLRSKFTGGQKCEDPGSRDTDFPPDPSRTDFGCSTTFQGLTEEERETSSREQIRIWCDPDTGASSFSEQQSVPFSRSLQTFWENDSSILCLKRYIKEHCTDGYPVPNIVHLVAFTNPTMSFRNAIGFYSIFTVAKPCLVLLHSDVELEGPNWDIMAPSATNLVRVHRKPLDYINKRKIKFVQTKADLARIDVLAEYGGIYLDSDMVIFRNMDIFRAVQFAANKAGSNANLANGIMFSVPGAELLKIWRDHWKTYLGTSWNSHSVLLITKLAKWHPTLMSELGPIFIKFGPANQEKLYKRNCHLKESYAAHLFKGALPKNADFEYVKKINTTFGRIARYILFGDSNLCNIDDEESEDR